MKWIGLFVTPAGAIGRRTFQHGVVVVVFVNVLITVAAMALRLPVGWPVLATLWPTACVTTKRLHTFGLSGWVQAPQRATVGSVLAATAAPGINAWPSTHPWLVLTAFGFLLTALAADAALYGYLLLSPRGPSETLEQVFG
ncbi:MAG TPA: hypothetical protein VGF50_12810 [Caulobacteraceae bacterium]|jgi:uncharacterized membrane protein YhaH (DUF805 family)